MYVCYGCYATGQSLARGRSQCYSGIVHPGFYWPKVSVIPFHSELACVIRSLSPGTGGGWAMKMAWRWRARDRGERDEDGVTAADA